MNENETPPCKTHPDAPHGFDRNASHNADRYVCECESWEPVDAINMSQERGDETAKGEHEPVAWLDSDGFPWSKEGVECRTTQDTYTPLYTAPPKKEWVGLTYEEVNSWDLPDKPTVFEFAQFIEAKLKEKNT